MAHITITTEAFPEGPPTVTAYQQFAAETIDALDKIQGVIPKLDDAEASGTKIAGSRLAVPDTFIATVIATVEQLSELAASGKLDPVEARDALQYIEAFRPLCDKLFTVTKRLNYALMWLRDSLAGKALQVYRIAKQHASDKRSPLMAAHVANMKRTLGKKVPTKAEREQRKLARMTESERAQEEVQKAA